MICANGKTAGGGALLLIGLSDANVDELRKGRPIHMTRHTHPAVPEGLTVLLIHGTTEQAMYEVLKEAGVLDGARVIVDPGMPG